jgi:helicase-like protein
MERKSFLAFSLYSWNWTMQDVLDFLVTEERNLSSTNTDAYGQARESILHTMRGLLIGPMEANEVLRRLSPDAEPIDFYLTGILWPGNITIGAAEDENTDKADDDDTDLSDDSGAPLFSILKPSSIGLTCTINGEDTQFDVIARGARYVPKQHVDSSSDAAPEKGETIPEEAGTYTLLDWERKPFEYHLHVAGTESRKQWKTHSFMTSGGNEITDDNVAIHIRRRVRNGTLIVTASLLNTMEHEEGHALGHLCLYQAELEVRTSDEKGAGNLLSRPSSIGVPDDDVLVGDLLYRNFHEFAAGHGVATMWPEPVNDPVSYVRTEWLPYQSVYSVSRTGSETFSALVKQKDTSLAAAFLAKISNRVDIVKGLGELCKAYEIWINQQAWRIDSLHEDIRQTAETNLAVCRVTLDRIREGINLINRDDLVFKAFCLANEAMDAQATGRQRGDSAKPLVWYPFQMAFILLTIPSIANPLNPARSTMDLLWFPTGGGKTEAYLGLTAFTIFYKRLNRKAGGLHVDVLMRYTLRLLTVQQFQRAAALICAADQIRLSRRSELGDEPISIGVYVGEAATPNKLVEGRVNAIQVLEEEQRGKEPSCTPRLLLNCPLCGADLSHFCYKVNLAVPTLEIICPESSCPSKGRPLPVYTVDEDIYRNKPSLIIGTVDKFAQLPRNENQGLLFGRSGGIPPELIIQDELHLISGPLGTMAGLYEVCIDLMCSQGAHTPKIIGSTATIGRAHQQVKALFDREVLQFPPSALDADNSFFAVTDRNAPDRRYLGISSAGRSPKFTLQAVTAAALAASQRLINQRFDNKAIDPYWTLLLYFNSLRELGGAKIMMQDDVQRSNAFYSARLCIDERRIEGESAELTSRIPSTRIPKILRYLEFPLDGDPFEGMPVDIILASNMISVGMDIPRLGFMIVNGQPKSTSEYIQATSRVGRGIPGLIFTIFNAARPRDISHFEHFVHYHETLYRRVEVTSVTPWSSRSRDRALHAIFVAAVRHLIPGMSGRFGAAEFNPDDPLVAEIQKWIMKRAESAGTAHVSREDIRDELNRIVARWAAKARMYRGNGKFEYWATSRPYDNRPVNPHLMRGAEDPVIDRGVWATQNSMRDVEPSAYYVVLPENVED